LEAYILMIPTVASLTVMWRFAYFLGVFETLCIPCPCTELLPFNYAKINSISNSRAPLR